jgi:hypothetical protein
LKTDKRIVLQNCMSKVAFALAFFSWLQSWMNFIKCMTWIQPILVGYNHRWTLLSAWHTYSHLFLSQIICSPYLYRAAPYKLMFIYFRDALFFWRMQSLIFHCLQKSFLSTFKTDKRIGLPNRSCKLAFALAYFSRLKSWTIFIKCMAYMQLIIFIRKHFFFLPLQSCSYRLMFI